MVDDVDSRDRRMTLYAGNGLADVTVDPGFNLGERDNLALLAPGASNAFGDDRGIAFVSRNAAVTAARFGIVVDGVTGSE